MEWFWWCLLGLLLIHWIGKKQLQARIEKARVFEPEAAHGSARYATKKDLKRAGLFKSGGIHIGFFGGRKLFMNNAGHILVCAGARTGKLVTVLCSLVLTLPKRYSLAIFDPKGEISCICLHFLKASGRSVYVLNPFKIWLDRMKGLTQATLNPMSSLDPKSAGFHADCDKLADAICYEENHGGDSHWIISARLLISGVIAALRKYGATSDQTLVAMRNVITGASGQSVYDFCRECMALPGTDIYVRQKLGRFAADKAEENKELNSIVSTADTQTGWIGNQAIAESLKGGPNEITFRELKQKPGTVISVCLPLDKLDVSHKYFRVVLTTGISVTLAEGLRGKTTPVAFLADEIAQIGPSTLLSNCWGMAAGAAALQIIAVYQNFSQIVTQFGNNFQTAIANSGLSLWFGVRDPQTAQFCSTMAGVSEVLSRSHNLSFDTRTGEPQVGLGTSQTSRPLLHADEVQFGLGSDEMLLFADRLPGVCRAQRKPYFESSDLKGKYRDNPYFQKDGAAARLVRWLFE